MKPKSICFIFPTVAKYFDFFNSIMLKEEFPSVESLYPKSSRFVGKPNRSFF